VPTASLTTLHLYGVPRSGIPAAVAHMGADRRTLARTPGLAFFKLLGTGDGRTFTLRDADPGRWGLLAVWCTPPDLAAFERRSPVAASWRRRAGEVWRADLLPLRSRGTWAGRRPFEPTGTAPRGGGPVAALTRARLRPSRSRTFWRAVPPVALDAQATPGLRFAVGIGESPVGLQGTFSIWDSPAALAAFAYRGAAHREAITRTATVGWYAEELFARFAVLQTTGTVDGADPLPPAGPPPPPPESEKRDHA
jgi:hypothetical protein